MLIQAMKPNKAVQKREQKKKKSEMIENGGKSLEV